MIQKHGGVVRATTSTVVEMSIQGRYTIGPYILGEHIYMQLTDIIM